MKSRKKWPPRGGDESIAHKKTRFGLACNQVHNIFASPWVKDKSAAEIVEMAYAIADGLMDKLDGEEPEVPEESE